MRRRILFEHFRGLRRRSLRRAGCHGEQVLRSKCVSSCKKAGLELELTRWRALARGMLNLKLLKLKERQMKTRNENPTAGHPVRSLVIPAAEPPGTITDPAMLGDDRFSGSAWEP